MLRRQARGLQRHVQAFGKIVEGFGRVIEFLDDGQIAARSLRGGLLGAFQLFEDAAFADLVRMQFEGQRTETGGFQATMDDV